MSELTDEQLRRFIELDEKANCTDAELDEWMNMRFDDQREVYVELLQARARVAELEHAPETGGDELWQGKNPVVVEDAE